MKCIRYMLGTVACCVLALGQGADLTIRVESRQVLVPTLVVDEDRLRTTPKTGNLSAVNDLSASDFRLFEDGIEQKIERVAIEHLRYAEIRDNRGSHNEYSDTPKGKWSYSDIWPPTGFVPPSPDPPGSVVSRSPGYFYLLAFTPRQSPDGSCHRVKVKVARRNSLVYARKEYCKIPHSASDPLKGTPLGRELTEQMNWREPGKLSLFSQIGYVYNSAGLPRVYLAFEFPWQSIKRRWSDGKLDATVGIMGVVQNKDGIEIAQFSDLACCGADEPHLVQTGDPYRDHSESDIFYVPNRYETQIDLPAGQYVLRVVLGDGARFGRIEVPLNIGAYDKKELATSTVMLCKRFHPYRTNEYKVNQDYLPLVSKDIEFTPTGDTRFHKGEPLIAYFEVYEPPLGKLRVPDIHVQIKVVDAKSGETRMNSQTVDVSSYVEADSSAIRVARQIPVENLPVGTYRLEVEAHGSTEKLTVRHTADFTVE